MCTVFRLRNSTCQQQYISTCWNVTTDPNYLFIFLSKNNFGNTRRFCIRIISIISFFYMAGRNVYKFRKTYTYISNTEWCGNIKIFCIFITIFYHNLRSLQLISKSLWWYYDYYVKGVSCFIFLISAKFTTS